MNVAWQTWLVIVFASMSFAISLVLDSGSGIVLAPLTAILLKTLAFAIPVVTNQLKAISSSSTPSYEQGKG